MQPTAETTALERFLEPLTDSLSPETARQIIDFHADEETQALIDELALKANEGTLSPDESRLYAEYVRAIDLVAILQAKARQALLSHG